MVQLLVEAIRRHRIELNQGLGVLVVDDLYGIDVALVYLATPQAIGRPGTYSLANIVRPSLTSPVGTDEPSGGDYAVGVSGWSPLDSCAGGSCPSSANRLGTVNTVKSSGLQSATSCQ